MRKLFFALLAAIMLLPATAAAGNRSTAEVRSQGKAQEAEKVLLRESVRVNGRIVRLGDLFSSAGDRADIAVAYAPEPGKRAIFDARWLSRVARAYKLNWRPMSVRDQVVVERESQVITRGEIEDNILAALIERGADANTKVELSNRMMRLYVPGNASTRIGVEDVAYEERTGRFTAILVAPIGEPAATRTRVSGRLFKVTEIPILTRRILKGEIISKRDIKWTTIRSDRLHRDTIGDINDLIGKTPKRGLRADIPIRTADVQRPILVPKGSLVTIILKAPRMMLTAQGKALENGSYGDTIRITNTQSNTVIEAEVTGTARVAVLPTSFLAMN